MLSAAWFSGTFYFFSSCFLAVSTKARDRYTIKNGDKITLEIHPGEDNATIKLLSLVRPEIFRKIFKKSLDQKVNSRYDIFCRKLVRRQN